MRNSPRELVLMFRYFKVKQKARGETLAQETKPLKVMSTLTSAHLVVNAFFPSLYCFFLLKGQVAIILSVKNTYCVSLTYYYYCYCYYCAQPILALLTTKIQHARTHARTHVHTQIAYKKR